MWRGIFPYIADMNSRVSLKHFQSPLTPKDLQFIVASSRVIRSEFQPTIVPSRWSDHENASASFVTAINVHRMDVKYLDKKSL